MKENLQAVLPLVSFEIMNGAQLKEWREGHGLSQNDLAQRLGTTQPTIFRWEKGGVYDDKGRPVDPLARTIPPYLELALNWIDLQIKTEKKTAAKG